MFTPPRQTSLRQLASILTSSVETIEQHYEAQGLAFPSLDEPWNPFHPAEQLVVSSNVAGAIACIVAAANQLAASVKIPAVAILEAGMAAHVSTSVGVAEELNVTQILNDAGSAGMDVKSIARRANTNADTLARVLRLLATNHIYKETAPDIFANNRLSSALALGKDIKAIHERPGEKYDGSSGVAAMLAHVVQEVAKSSLFLIDTVKSKERVSSHLPNETAFNLAFNTNLPFWDWLDQPINVHYKMRFGAGMDGTTKMEPGDAIMRGFDWSSIPAGGTIVDVGGGIGATSMIVAKKYPTFKVVVQDRSAVVPDGVHFWNTNYPEAVKVNQVTFAAHDFFEPQPVKGASVYLLRAILHNWSDAFSTKILTHLRDAADPSTQLLLVDHINSYTCELPPSVWRAPGDDRPTAPAPLLANFGSASTSALFDLQMLTLLNGKERTVQQLDKLLKATGWQIQRVYHLQGSPLGQVVATPIPPPA